MNRKRTYAQRITSILVLLVAVSFLLSACQTKRVINSNGFIQTVTVDKADTPNQYYFGITFPELKPDGKAKAVYLAYKANDFEEAYNHFMLQTRFQLVVGQIRNIIIGKSLAEDGEVLQALSNLLILPKFPITTRLMIYEGEAREFLKLGEDITDFHLYKLLLKMQKIRHLSMSTIFNFIRDEIETGIEPYVSIVTIKNKSASLQGIALFLDSHMAGKLKEEEVNYMLLLRSTRTRPVLHIDKQDAGTPIPISLENTSSKRKVKVIETSPIPKIEITLNMKGTLITTLSETTTTEKISEQQIEQAIEKKLRKVLEKLQSLRTDTIGLGQYVRNRMPMSDWNEKAWPELFQKADIQCKVKFHLENEI